MTAFTDDQLADIQGFGLAGFSKDAQESLFLRFGSAATGKALISWLAPRVANAWEVGHFNAVFREIRHRTGGAETVAATWTAVMISAAGYGVLGVPLSDLPPGASATAFGVGMAGRSSQIGDTQPSDVPTNWQAPFGSGANQVHMAVVVASDDECDLDEQLVAIYEKAVETGCEIVFHERGATLPAPLTGHEHFGFKDGISQPAIADYSDPPVSGEPPAVPAGEFVLGFPDGSTPPTTIGAGTLWANGSYVVFRRLAQDVAAFRALATAGVPGASPALTAARLGAAMVGRWPSGAPVEMFPAADPGPNNESNAFAFNANGDTDGHVCPVWAHIRKANPRDETTPDPTNDSPARRRMIRRGIPFGPPLPSDATADDGVPRGLHFYCVVSDLDRQFEFIQRNWLNEKNFPVGGGPGTPGGPYNPPTPGTLPGGPDPVVGEHDQNAECVLTQASGAHPFPVAKELVQVTAGEYFFLPSLTSLAHTASS